MTDDPLSSFKTKNLSGLASWDGFLPAGAIVMARAADVNDAEAALAAAEAAPVPAAAGGTKLRFQFEVPGIENAAESELFHKILAALELNSSDYEISSTTRTGAQALATVRFTANMEDQGDVGAFEPSFHGGVSITTFSMAAMLKNPGLKKPVWAHLKETLMRVRAQK